MQSASATSLNFVGFEDMKGYGTPPLHFGQIYIEPNLPVTSGSRNLASAGFVPGQQSYLKLKRDLEQEFSRPRPREAGLPHRQYVIKMGGALSPGATRLSRSRYLSRLFRH